MTFETLILDRDNGVVTLTLNRPEPRTPSTARCGPSCSHVFREVASEPRRPRRSSSRVPAATSARGGRVRRGDRRRDTTSARCARWATSPSPCTGCRSRRSPRCAAWPLAPASTWPCCAISSSPTRPLASRRSSPAAGCPIDFGGSWVAAAAHRLHLAKELALSPRSSMRPPSGAHRPRQPGRARRRAGLVRRRLGTTASRRAADRALPDQAAAQRRRRAHAGAGARRGGPGTG